MTVGMAGVAGTILGAYASMIGEQLLPYLLAASFMSAPGGILMAKIMMPDDPKDIGIEPVIMPEASHDEEKIRRAHVCTQINNAHLVYSILLEHKKLITK